LADPLPDFDHLVARLQTAKAKRLEVTGYRSATPKYARETDLLTGAGSRQHGGRWNPPGVAAVYASLTPEVAMEEALAHFRYYGIPPHAAMPRTFVAIHARLSRVLDLTEGAVRRRLRIAEQRMLEADWRRDLRAGREALPQLVGRAAHAAGLEALLVRSTQDPAGKNLVVFPENLRSSSQLYVLDPERLSPEEEL